MLQLVAGNAFIYGNAFDYNRELGTDGYIDGIFNGACDMKEVPKESPYLAYVFVLYSFPPSLLLCSVASKLCW